jgi:hypothetical protein
VEGEGGIKRREVTEDGRKEVKKKRATFITTTPANTDTDTDTNKCNNT